MTRAWAVAASIAAAAGLAVVDVAVLVALAAGNTATEDYAAVPATIVGALFAFTAGPWVALLLGIAAVPAGRAYLRQPGSEAVAEVALRTQPNYLVFAGLVFAGLAVLPKDSASQATLGFLTVALCAFVCAWAVGIMPADYVTTVLSDALHWTGLASLGVAVLGLATTYSTVPGQMAGSLTLVVIGAASLRHVRAFIRQVARAAQGLSARSPAA